MSSSHYRIVGTAGHIDHGKSALVRALTGVDPDRLQEEKERGITIDLGFADTEVGEHHVAFVDVPGHERFVKNMLAGIGGIDAVLLVVAADESIMPQTREHLAICELLGIRHGLVAVTKVDLVDDEIAELVELEVEELLHGTALAGSPIVRTSVTRGDGLETLRDRLANELAAAAVRPGDGILRMPIDRVFTIRGHGTVCTGTLLSGCVTRGDRLAILPGSQEAVVRGIQVHGRESEQAVAGQRTALNLQGVSVEQLRRGMTLAAPGTLASSWMVDARLRALPQHGGFEQLQRIRFHHGAAEVLGRVRLLEGDTIQPGADALVQLHLESEYPAVPGDRFVVRRYSPLVTIGGGIVIDRPARKHRARPETIARLRSLESAGLAERLRIHVEAAGVGGTTAAELAVRLGAPRSRVEESLAQGVEDGALVGDPTGRLVAERLLAPLREQVVAAVGRHHASFRLRPAMPKEELRSALEPAPPAAVLELLLVPLLADGSLRAEGDGYAAGDHVPRLTGSQRTLAEELLARFADAGLAPPAPEAAYESLDLPPEEAREVLHFLLRAGELVRVRDDLVIHADALDRLVAGLRERFDRAEQFSVADFRDWAGVTRKHAIPLLEHLDSRRVTRRVGDNRERM